MPLPKGFKHSLESRKKMSLSQKGKVKVKGVKFSEEHKKKLSQAHKDNPVKYWLGKKMSLATREKMSKKQKEIGNKPPIIKGARSNFWKGGVTKINSAIRSLSLMKQWRSNVFQRDNWTCQTCNTRGCYLEAHHIKKLSSIIKEDEINNTEQAICNEKLWDINNGVTLCLECHNKTKEYGKCRKKQ